MRGAVSRLVTKGRMRERDRGSQSGRRGSEGEEDGRAREYAHEQKREREREADRQRTERILIRRDCNGRELQIGKTGANLEVGM
jgi:hypothetical protein